MYSTEASAALSLIARHQQNTHTNQTEKRKKERVRESVSESEECHKWVWLVYLFLLLALLSPGYHKLMIHYENVPQAAGQYLGGSCSSQLLPPAATCCLLLAAVTSIVGAGYKNIYARTQAYHENSCHTQADTETDTQTHTYIHLHTGTVCWPANVHLLELLAVCCHPLGIRAASAATFHLYFMNIYRFQRIHICVYIYVYSSPDSHVLRARWPSNCALASKKKKNCLPALQAYVSAGALSYCLAPSACPTCPTLHIHCTFASISLRSRFKVASIFFSAAQGCPSRRRQRK